MRKKRLQCRIVAVVICACMACAAITPPMALNAMTGDVSGSNVSQGDVGQTEGEQAGYGTDEVSGGDANTADVSGNAVLMKDGLQTYTLSMETISNWEKGWGLSDLSLQENRFVMVTGNGNESNVPAYAIAYDKNSPILENGELTATLKNNAYGRFCLVFRYQDKDNYSAVGYDYGNWVVKNRVNGRESTDTFSGKDPRNGKDITIKATFIGKNLTVSIDGEDAYSKDFLDDSLKGRMGVRTWGYTGNYASVSVASMTYNEVKAPERDENGNYMNSFTDEDCCGGWRLAWHVSNQGSEPEFTYGPGDEGYMIVQAGPDGTMNGNTFYQDTLSPVIDNGFLEFDVTNLGDGRLGFLYRVQELDSGTKSYVGIQYDLGAWNIAINGQTKALAGIPDLPLGKKVHIRIEYVGTNVRMQMDGEEVLNQNFPGSDIGEGQIGLRVWGYGSGGSLGKMKVDNVVNGFFNAVLLDPFEKYVLGSEAGSYDIPVKLSQTSNSFVGIKADDADLKEGEDYTVNDARDTITIKKEYVKKAKELGISVLTFVFEDGYMTDFQLRIQQEEEEVFYERSFAEGMDGFELVEGTAQVKHNADKRSVNILNGRNAIFIDQNAPELHNSEVEFIFDPVNDSGNLAVMLRYQDENNWIAVGINGVGGNHTNWYLYTPTGAKALFGNDVNQTKGDGDGQRLYSRRAAPYTVKVRLVENTVTVWLDGAEILQSVVSGLPDGKGKAGVYYRNGAGADIYSLNVRTANPLQTEKQNIAERVIASDSMKVTVDEAFPRVIRYELGGKSLPGQEKAYYVAEVNNIAFKPEVTAQFEADKAVYHVTTDQGSFDVIYKVVDNVLEMELVNVDESIRTVNFPNQSMVSMPSTAQGASLRESNYTSEWTYDLANTKEQSNHRYTTLAVLSSEELAATVNCGSIKSRSELCFQTFVNGDHYTTGLWPNEFLIRGLDNDVIEGGNWAKVAITGDRNQDGKVDYQDGAIALRDDIPTQRYSSKDLFNAYTSIAVNEASWVQHPFLMTLDIVKKMSLGLDGFQQNVIYKGYQSQGHDSGHPNFADIGEQAGGSGDFRVLIEEAQKYGASIGVHINETETYPEAPQYGALASNNGGWSWYDNANQMVRENDILTSYASSIPGGNMEKRLDDLNEITQTETSNLGIVYVDTYFDTRWPAYRLAHKLNSNGWALATEYTDEFTKDSIWGHHISGIYNNAGNLVRFVNNGTQDIFAYSNLFRGPRDRHSTGIYGWQADAAYGQNYANTIEDFFIRILPNKYLANYPINIWENDREAKLGYHNEVVTKWENGKNSIYKNDELIADGNNIFIPWDPQEETKIYHWNAAGGTTTWKLPESWQDESSVKLFKLSDQGRTDVVELDVNDDKTVTITALARTGYVVYRGSDPVRESDLTQYDWSEGSPVKDTGFNSYSWDYAWEKSSSSGSTDHITYSNENATVIGQGDTNILIKGKADGVLTQAMTGLTGGKTYSASVFADVQDGRRATISVTTPDGVTASNYTEHYYTAYGSGHSNKKGSRYQRITVQFTVPEGESSAVLTLEAAPGTDESSYVRFDDVRVFEVEKNDAQGHYYYNDFEHFDVGFGPFENGISGQNHMSETSQFNNDTISGRYSLKIQNYARHQTASTTPVTLRFPENTECTVSVKYLVSQGGGYVLSAKENGQVLGSAVMEATGMGAENAKTAVITFTTGDTGEAYLDLARTNGTIILDELTVDITDDEKPDSPSNLAVDNITKDSAFLTWKAATDNVGVVEYRIFVGDVMTAATAATQYRMTGLAPETSYTVKVVAVDANGNESEAASLEFRTEKAEIPTEPTEEPTDPPTEEPTEQPTEEPTEQPTEEPTEQPTEQPTEEPTEQPTEQPTEEPTEQPTEQPSQPAESTNQPSNEDGDDVPPAENDESGSGDSGKKSPTTYDSSKVTEQTSQRTMMNAGWVCAVLAVILLAGSICFCIKKRSSED